MSNLTEHAQYELNRAGLLDDDSDYGGVLGKAVLELIDAFAKQGHSGYSAMATIDLFTTLASYKPLGPITADPSEWVEVAHQLWQNRRNGDAFSEDGGRTYTLNSEAVGGGGKGPIHNTAGDQ